MCEPASVSAWAMRINRVDAELYEAVEKKGDYTNRPNYQKPRNKAIK